MENKYELAEVLDRIAGKIVVVTQNDDGSPHEYLFANENAAQEQERKWTRRGVSFYRKG